MLGYFAVILVLWSVQLRLELEQVLPTWNTDEAVSTDDETIQIEATCGKIFPSTSFARTLLTVIEPKQLLNITAPPNTHPLRTHHPLPRLAVLSVTYLAEEGLGSVGWGAWLRSTSREAFRLEVSGRQTRGETDRGETKPRSSSSLYFLSMRTRRAVSLSNANWACSRACWACTRHDNVNVNIRGARQGAGIGGSRVLRLPAN